jgi:hypothetical protein
MSPNLIPFISPSLWSRRGQTIGAHLVWKTLFTAAVGLMGRLVLDRPLPALQLKDQHDRIWRIPADTRWVIFAAGRKASSVAQAVLQNEPPTYLTKHRAVYVADMSKMPAFATRMFAMPSLREMPFTIGVSLNEATLADWPHQPDKLTLISLNHGLVKSVRYVATETDLRSALAH